MKDLSTISKTEMAGKRVVRSLSRFIDFLLLVLLVWLIIIAGYAWYDSNNVYESASKEEYIMYKPTEHHTETFDELVAINPDVLGWLTVYGTGIDYPLIKSEKSNDEYISTDVKKQTKASGSLFLDWRNKRDFSDFNTIIFGHHMEHSVMFGDIDKFGDKSYFDSHQYGDIFFSGKNHGLEIAAYMEVDAYDTTLYRPGVGTEQLKQDYLNYIKEHAKHYRDLGLTTNDHIVVMSTCSADITNGRFILIGKIVDSTFDNPYQEEEKVANTGTGIDQSSFKSWLESLPKFVWILGLLLIILLIYLIERLVTDRYWRKQKTLDEEEESTDETA